MNSIWKYIATAAIAVLVTLGGAWFTVNGQAITRAQVQEMIKPDHQLAQQTYDELKQLRGEVQEMNREIGELKGLLAARGR